MEMDYREIQLDLTEKEISNTEAIRSHFNAFDFLALICFCTEIMDPTLLSELNHFRFFFFFSFITNS